MPAQARPRAIAPGVTVAVLIALGATAVAPRAPFLGAPILAVALGAACANIRALDTRLRPGAVFVGKRVLQAAIILLGATLSLADVWQTGRRSLVVMLASLLAGLVAAAVVGRLLAVGFRLRSLIAVGSAICGASAIAAAAPVVAASAVEVAYAISTVFFFNLVALVTFPALGELVGMSPEAFALWAGTAVNDTSSVVAVAVTHGDAAVHDAIVVKVVRTLMIIPLVAGLAAVARGADAPRRPRVPIPGFVVLFVAAALFGGFALEAVQTELEAATRFLITVAITGIGMQAKAHDLRTAGSRPLVLGLVAWASVAVTSFALIALGPGL